MTLSAHKITFDVKTYRLSAVKTLYICAFTPNHAHRLVTQYGMTFTVIDFRKRLKVEQIKLNDVGIYEKTQNTFKRIFPREK